MANDPRERGVELMFHGRKEEWSSKMGFWEGVLGGGSVALFVWICVYFVWNRYYVMLCLVVMYSQGFFQEFCYVR